MCISLIFSVVKQLRGWESKETNLSGIWLQGTWEFLPGLPASGNTGVKN